MIGLELQKPNTGGGAIIVFKRGQVCQSLSRAMERSSRLKDEERQQCMAGNDEIAE